MPKRNKEVTNLNMKGFDTALGGRGSQIMFESSEPAAAICFNSCMPFLFSTGVGYTRRLSLRTPDECCC
jgi:hypothetical protein